MDLDGLRIKRVPVRERRRDAWVGGSTQGREIIQLSTGERRGEQTSAGEKRNAAGYAATSGKRDGRMRPPNRSNDNGREHERHIQNSNQLEPSRLKASQNASGSGEIEAAKRSLATAKKWAASTVDTLETAEERLKEAEKCVSDAKSQAKSARKQVEEAEAYLKSVEQEWEVIEIDEDSDDDLARAPKRPKQGNGDRASLDAVRIAVGKKVFKSGCKLSLQLGTRNPYILFSFLDGKGKKKEHTVLLKDDELKELRYYVDADEANDIDDAMSVIAFRITPSEKNDFARYPNWYDPDATEMLEKRYIAVELRDADELQAMLDHMRLHPDLDVWCNSEASLPAQDVFNYTKAFIWDNQQEKESRLRRAG